MEKLGEKLQQHMLDAGGTWGISLKNIRTNETWCHFPNESFYAASIIKIPIMMAAFEAHHHGSFSLEDHLLLRAEDIVGGAGVLQHMSPGTKLTIYDVLTLMIIQSDNTATNMMIDVVGKDNIQQTIKDIGLQDSHFHNKLMTVPVKRAGANVITAADMTKMLQTIVRGEYTSHYACEHMIDILKKQQHTARLPARLPRNTSSIIGTHQDWSIAHKTGSVSGVVHDVGVFYVDDQQLLVSILSKDVDDYFAEHTIANMGLDLYNYLKGN